MNSGFTEQSQNERVEKLKEKIRDIPDFPKPGIVFKDITTLLNDQQAFHDAVDLLCAPYIDKKIDQIIAIEARGFILGSAMAYRLNAGVVPARKKGKLPGETFTASYQLEYGTDVLEIHADALGENERVIIVDDVLATGGTIGAVIDLMQQSKSVICGISCLLELRFLKGIDKLKGHSFFSVISYE